MASREGPLNKTPSRATFTGEISGVSLKTPVFADVFWTCPEQNPLVETKGVVTPEATQRN